MPKKLNIQDWLARLDNWLWHPKSGKETAPKRFLWQSGRILFAVVRDLFSGTITLHAMSLVYTTLLSVVPFLALSFSVLKGFGVHNQLEPILQAWAAPLGPKGVELTDNIIHFVDNYRVGVLGSLGFGLLIYAVISLVQKVERSFNEIWRVHQLRSFGQRFSNYLSVIIIGPVLVFTAMGATAALVSSGFVAGLIEIGPLGWIYSLLSGLMPYLMMIGLFTFLYVFIPNTKVKVKYAFVGGLIAGILWQSIGVAFANVFALSASAGRYAAIYSGFAIGIISLIWLYASWLILLIGSSIAFYAQHATQITRSRSNTSSATVDEHMGLAIVYRVARQFDSEGGGASIDNMETNLAVGPEAIERIRHKLIRHGILVAAGEDSEQLLPARTLDKITLLEVLQALRRADSPLPHSLTRDKPVTQITELLEQAHKDALQDMTLSEWIRQAEDKGTTVAA